MEESRNNTSMKWVIMTEGDQKANIKTYENLPIGTVMLQAEYGMVLSNIVTPKFRLAIKRPNGYIYNLHDSKGDNASPICDVPKAYAIVSSPF